MQFIGSLAEDRLRGNETIDLNHREQEAGAESHSWPQQNTYLGSSLGSWKIIKRCQVPVELKELEGMVEMVVM